MKLRILFTSLFILVVRLSNGDTQPDAWVPQPNSDQEAIILASTLQIAMFEQAEENSGVQTGSRGLGTLVTYGNEVFIVTHDHWSTLNPRLHEVELRNTSGDLLLTLNADAFRALIVYRDGGTLVFWASAAFQSLVPATIGPPVNKGDIVWFARRAANSGRATVEVVSATITAVDAEPPSRRIKLRNLDGSAVFPGDSGGGVWVNGQLVGNVWAAGMSEGRGLWSSLLGGNDSRPTDLVIAALQPLGN